MRPLIACLPLMIALTLAAACDRKKEGAGQAAGNAAAPIASEAAGPPSAEPQMLDRSHKGEAMPAVPFAAPGGAPATLGPMRGHPVLVNLWATWCQPCLKELPALDRLAAARKGTLSVVAISQDTQGEAVVQRYWQGKGFTALVPYTDAGMRVSEAIVAAGYPTSVLYDSKGREIWRVSGDLDWTGTAATRLLAEAR